KEAVTRMRTVRLRGRSVRATSQPIGAARRQHTRLTLAAMMRVVSSGSRNAGSVKRVLKLASVKERPRSVKAKTMIQPIGSVTSRHRTSANAAITAAERSMRAGKASRRRDNGSRVMAQPFAKQVAASEGPRPLWGRVYGWASAWRTVNTRGEGIDDGD